MNQQLNNATWMLLGTFTMTAGQNDRVELSDIADANSYVIADAVAFSPVDAPNKAVWTPPLVQRDHYNVYAWWHANFDRATNAPFTVYHDDGSTQISENQQLNSAQWNLLGTFAMTPGQNGRVELTDRANGSPAGTYVIADAVRFAPVAEAKSASWNLAVAATGSYRLYAKWPASASLTPEAVYTVSYQGGTADVVMNQRENGGKWNLLGTFPFAAGGSGYKVSLAESSLGTVAADALYIVSDAAPSDSFTWTPTIATAGDYQVFARWVASSTNSSAATYTITHASGTSTATVNQKQNGGVWTLLGTYNFAANAGNKVALGAAADGTVIADAILLVGQGTQPGNLLYVHPDHLGTPQKITDSTQAIVWDGQFDPFGTEFLIAGTAEMPLRFPGQYADDETGYSYNHFRDYDPSVGRYLESDPIGIGDNIDTYAYVSANPVIWIDPMGTGRTKIDGEVITVHKNDPDPFPSDPHGHIEEGNRKVDKDGIIYDRDGNKIGQLSKKGKKTWFKFLRKFDKAAKCGLAILFLYDVYNEGVDTAVENAIDDALWPLNDPDIGYGIGEAQ